ncbi:MAG: hypothetical protein FWG71_03810, partial [Synergistaceae bacterium]|nr:hypothetical protein [Synergistaceae bacterium]
DGGTVVFEHIDDAGFVFSSNITGDVSVEAKDGTTILTGANNYTGTTLVDGELFEKTVLGFVDGALGSGTVTVKNKGVLRWEDDNAAFDDASKIEINNGILNIGNNALTFTTLPTVTGVAFVQGNEGVLTFAAGITTIGTNEVWVAEGDNPVTLELGNAITNNGLLCAIGEGILSVQANLTNSVSGKLRIGVVGETGGKLTLGEGFTITNWGDMYIHSVPVTFEEGSSIENYGTLYYPGGPAAAKLLIDAGHLINYGVIRYANEDDLKGSPGSGGGKDGLPGKDGGDGKPGQDGRPGQDG